MFCEDLCLSVEWLRHSVFRKAELLGGESLLDALDAVVEQLACAIVGCFRHGLLCVVCGVSSRRLFDLLGKFLLLLVVAADRTGPGDFVNEVEGLRGDPGFSGDPRDGVEGVGRCLGNDVLEGEVLGQEGMVREKLDNSQVVDGRDARRFEAPSEG